MGPAISKVASRFTKPASATALLAILVLAGCGNRTPPAASDSAQARTALETALDAWKSGAAPEALLAGQPPIRVSDEDWRDGRKLLGYQLAGDGELYGLRQRVPVVLTLEWLPGQVEQKTVNYAVATNPSLVVRRDDREN